VTRSALGRVADPAALDDETGAIGALELSVPTGWAGGRARVRVPRVVTCQRCEGGGCDACGRGGALRTPEDEAARAITVQLPADLSRAVAIRVPRPFADASPIAQLILTFAPGPAGDRVELVSPARVAGGDDRSARRSAAPFWLVLLVGAAAALAIARVLAG
jgi:hypothetical protein